MYHIRTIIQLVLLVFFRLTSCTPAQNVRAITEVPVGVILDMNSYVGKTVNSCLSMAISDFYALNERYRTRIVLHTRDFKGEPLQVLSAALDLRKNHRVQAIIGPETTFEAKLLAEYGEKEEVPILSLAPETSSFSDNKYLLQILHDEVSEFKGISKLVDTFNWRNVILIYEETEDGRRILPILVDSFEEKNIRVSLRSAISPSTSDDQILKELSKIMTMQTNIFVVHMSPPLAARIFLKAKVLRIMREGYAWILTAWAMNLLNSIDTEVIHESMQGVLGIRAHIPASRALQNFTSRWLVEYHKNIPFSEVRGVNLFVAWAYDAIWALARAVEQVGVVKTPLSSMEILQNLLLIRFTGLSGPFHFVNGSQEQRVYEIINVIGNGDKRVGFWTLEDGLSRYVVNNSQTLTNLKTITWPGDSMTTPKGWKKKLRIAVPLVAPYKDLVKVTFDAYSNAKIVTGFCIDVFEAAIEALPYEVTYEYFPFSGSYNDLVDQVYFQNYDAAVGDITITANRSLYVDFTLPFTDLGVGTIARTENNNVWVFLKPLDSNLWQAIVVFLFVTGFVVWVIERPINKKFQGTPAQQIGTIIWFSLSTLVPAQREKLLSHLSRFVATVWVLIVLILTSSYTAILSSLLTVQQIQIATNAVSIGIDYGGNPFVQGTVVSNMNFKTSDFRRYNLPKEFNDALSQGRISAIIDEITYIKIFLGKYRNYSADFALVDSSQTTTNGFGFAFQKGSPMAPELSANIARLREQGMLKVLENKWFQIQSLSGNRDPDISKPRALGLDGFRGLFYISGISSFLAVFIFVSYAIKEKFNIKSYILRVLGGGKLVAMMKHFFVRNTNEVQQLSL